MPRKVVVSIAMVGLGLMLLTACGPSSHRRDDPWGDDGLLEPEITGDNEKDEARWRRELASDPWGDDARLLTDDPPLAAEAYRELDEEIPPLDFVGPPEPPSRWDTMQRRGGKAGKVMFSLLTVLVTLGMMAAPYLLMI